MADDVLALDARIDVAEIDLAAIRTAVDDALSEFFATKATIADGAEMAHVVDVLRDFLLAGGKRLRPLLCYLGWCAAGAMPMHAPVLRAAAALELFHAFALIHDDIIDSADSRRGRPSLHRRLAADHRRRVGAGAERLGASSAILVGDLAMTWSDELLHGSGLGLGALGDARPVLDAMRTELMYGQYLDLLGTGARSGDVATALRIARYKSGKYTVERPLHLGASLAGADTGVLEACTAFGLPVGEAFQLRDDVLGIFGDPGVTGKSHLDDLRDGKHTVLLAIASRQATRAQRMLLTRHVGDPELDDERARLVRDVLVDTGALASVERMIADRRREGLAALDRAPFHPAAAAALREIAHAATVRVA